MSDANQTFSQPQNEQKQCDLLKKLPPELVDHILELVLVPKLSLTVKRVTRFDQHRPQELREAIANGQGSIQAQIFRCCQMLYRRGLEIMYVKTTFRLTLHCETSNTMARTSDVFNPGKLAWVPVLYSRRAGRHLLRRFHNVELEIIPEMGGSADSGFVITWNGFGMVVDTLRFIGDQLRDKNVTITFTAPYLEADKVNLDELGIWMGALELIRCKSIQCPMFHKWMKLHRHTCPIALCTSAEDVVDLDERRIDFMADYFQTMRSASAAHNSYYDDTMPLKLRERAHLFNVRDYLYLRNLYMDRMDEVTQTKQKRPVEEDRQLIELYNKYSSIQLELRNAPENANGNLEADVTSSSS